MTLERYVTHVVHVEALQLSPDNMGEAAELSGAFMSWDANVKGFILVLEAPGRKTRVIPGMWLVRNGNSWVGMKDDRFRAKYQPESFDQTLDSLLDNHLNQGEN